MKKIIVTLALLLPLTIFVSGCNDNKKEDEDKEDELSSEERVQEEQENFEEKLKEMLVDSYEKENLKDYRHVDYLLSKDMTQRMNEQLKQDNHEFFEERKVEEFELYKSEDNENKYIYYMIVRTTDKKTKVSIDSNHYGVVFLVNENNKKKVDYLMEIDATERHDENER